MIDNNFQDTVQYTRLQAWGMTLICSLLFLFAVAAATRIPYYLAVPDYVRLVGVILFGLLASAGLIESIRTTLCLKQLQENNK